MISRNILAGADLKTTMIDYIRNNAMISLEWESSSVKWFIIRNFFLVRLYKKYTGTVLPEVTF